VTRYFFSLLGFENQNDAQRTPSLSYFCLPQTQNADAAWREILLRAPIPIEWVFLHRRGSSAKPSPRQKNCTVLSLSGKAAR